MRTALLLSAALLTSCATSRRPPTMALDTYEPIAVAQLRTSGDIGVGLVSFSASDEGVTVTSSLHDLTPRSIHGLHVHEGTTCGDDDFSEAGGHYAPEGDPHGAPSVPGSSHAGDLGNVIANDDGLSVRSLYTADLDLGKGEAPVVGRTVVLHAGRDDLASQPSGSAGPRMACGVVKLAPALSPEDFVTEIK